MNKIISLFSRYLLIIFAGLGNLYIFYKIFFPVTFYASSFVLSLFGEVSYFYSLNLIMYNEVAIEIVNACIAGSAYYLLFILVFSIPSLNLLKRVGILAYTFVALLIVNLFRIVIMALIAETTFFDSVHMVFWYLFSLVFVVGIWFSAVKIFAIKEIPVYSDFMCLVKQIKKSKRKSKNNQS